MSTSLLMSKIIDISTARLRRDQRERAKTMNDQEQRRVDRRSSSERLFIQIVTCDDESLVGTTLSCEAIDVSENGLKIRAPSPIPVGCVLDLWIDNDAGPGKYFLSSDVRWVLAVTGGFEAGLELHDGTATDINEWRRLQGA